jgi:hypothetical protein
MTISLINYNVGQTGRGIPDYLVRQIQAGDAETMEAKAAADSAAVFALNGPLSTDDQWTPADANLAGGGDGHTFVFTVTYVRRKLNTAVPRLAAFVGNLLSHANNAGSLDYPLPPATNVLITPTFVPGPEYFVSKFCLASAEQEIAGAFNDMVVRAIAATDNDNAPSFWQQLAGAAKGTRFMGGVTVFKFPNG